MIQHLPSIPVIVAALIAALTSFSRVFEVTRPGWGRLPAWLQTAAPLLLTAAGGIVAGLAGVHTGTDLMVVIVAGVFSVLPGAPSNRSAAPMQASKPVTGTPSAGDVAVAASLKDKSDKLPPPPKPPSGLGIVGGALAASSLMVLVGCACLVASLPGCAWFKGSVEPIAKECAPSPATLVAQVSQILLSGGDYEAALEQLALTDGADVLECAVKAAIQALMSDAGKVGASPEDGAAVARGKAYLAAHPVAQ